MSDKIKTVSSGPSYAELVRAFNMLRAEVQELRAMVESGGKVKAKRKILYFFEDSPDYDFEVFTLKLRRAGWDDAKIKQYYDAAKLYAETKAAKYHDWTAAVRSWDRKELKQAKTKTHGNEFAKRNAERAELTEQSRAALFSDL